MAGSRRPNDGLPATGVWTWRLAPGSRCARWPRAGSRSRGRSPDAGWSRSNSRVRDPLRCARRTNRSARGCARATGSRRGMWWACWRRTVSTARWGACTGGCAAVTPTWTRSLCWAAVRPGSFRCWGSRFRRNRRAGGATRCGWRPPRAPRPRVRPGRGRLWSWRWPRSGRSAATSGFTRGNLLGWNAAFDGRTRPGRPRVPLSLPSGGYPYRKGRRLEKPGDGPGPDEGKGLSPRHRGAPSTRRPA